MPDDIINPDHRVNKTHCHADRGFDAYWTPPEAIRALLRIETVPARIFIHAAVMAACSIFSRHAISGADVVDYGWRGTIVRDFLAGEYDLRSTAVVTNPPYELALPFIQKVLGGGSPYVAFLLRTNFLESMARKPFFEETPPSRIWVASRRLPMMHRLGYEGPQFSSNQSFAWFVWDSKSAESCRLSWFDWQEPAA